MHVKFNATLILSMRSCWCTVACKRTNARHTVEHTHTCIKTQRHTHTRTHTRTHTHTRAHTHTHAHTHIHPGKQPPSSAQSMSNGAAQSTNGASSVGVDPKSPVSEEVLKAQVSGCGGRGGVLVCWTECGGCELRIAQQSGCVASSMP